MKRHRISENLGHELRAALSAVRPALRRPPKHPHGSSRFSGWSVSPMAAAHGNGECFQGEKRYEILLAQRRLPSHGRMCDRITTNKSGRSRCKSCQTTRSPICGPCGRVVGRVRCRHMIQQEIHNITVYYVRYRPRPRTKPTDFSIQASVRRAA